MNEESPYNESYYQYYGGVGPYSRENAGWLTLFGSIAEQIIRRLKPRNTLEFGCAMGFLVESLRDRGVDARGADISEFAIDQVREDIKPYCTVRNILNTPGGERFDLVICMEVLEHLSPEDGERAIANLCALGDEVLFSSSPDSNHPDPTHQNVEPESYWIEAFSRHGFDPAQNADMTFVAPHALLFRRRGALRITFVSPTSEVNGGVRVIYQHAALLAGRGHIVTVASLDKDPPTWIALPPGLRFLAVPDDKAGFIEALPAGDVLIATLWTTAPMVAGAHASKGRKFYLVQHYESLWAGQPDDIDLTYSELPLRKLAVSSWLREILKTRFNEDSALILNGCDFSGKTHEARKIQTTGALRIGMLHHTLTWKGTSDGLKAFETLQKNYPEARLILFGVKRPSKLPPGCTEFYERPSRDELRSLFATLDIFISPSHSEGFGLPALEAMACGVPVVITDSGGCRDYADTTTALISPPGDPDSLSANLQRACGDPDLRDRFAVAGLAKANEFTWARAAIMMEAELREGVRAPAKLQHILYVSAGFRWADAYLDPFLIRGFESLGHQVTVFEPRPQDWQWEKQFVNLDSLDSSYARRYAAGCGKPPSDLLSAVHSTKPDLVFFNHALMIPAEVLNELRLHGVPTAVWMLDEPQEMLFSAERGRLFDYVFVQDRASLPFHWKTSNPNTFFMPHGLDPEVHRSGNHGEKLTPEEYSDVLMIGTGFPRRCEIVKALTAVNCKVLVIGRRWEMVKSSNVRILNHPVSFEKAARLYRGAKITINIHRDSDDFATSKKIPPPLSPNGSFFYIAGCGSLQFVDKNFAGADEFLMPGQHFVQFTSINDMLEKIEFYLRHPDHLKRIGRNAAETAHRFHTYSHRLSDALDVIGRPRSHRRIFGLHKSRQNTACPLSSIVVITRRNLQQLQNTLTMINRTLSAPCEFAVLHGSDQSIVQWLDKEQIRHVQTDPAQGLAGAFNMGARITNSEYVVYVTDDVAPFPNFARRLVSKLEAERDLAVVGPAMNFPGIPQDINCNFTRLEDMLEFSRSLYIREHSHLEDVPSVNPSCFALRRAALEAIGGFDERFPADTLEMEDFCQRARINDWRVGWSRSALVFYQSTLNPSSQSSAAGMRKARELYHKKGLAFIQSASAPCKDAEGERISFSFQRPAESVESSHDIKSCSERILQGHDIMPGKTSIIILTFNQIEYTKECVESISRHTPEFHEIIFVDNGSTDGTVKWLEKLIQEHPNYKLIENRKNLGFAKGCNQGMRASAGEYILLLNNDVVVTEGWLSGMLECLESSRETGIVGPMTNNISGIQKDLFADYQSVDRVDEYAKNYRERNRYRRIHVRRVVGYCMLFRRTLLEKIGMLDESFGSGNYEDDDFCLRAVLEGHKNFIAGDVFIHHYGSRSFAGNGIDYNSAMIRNKKIFAKKWSGVGASSTLREKLMIVKALENADNFHQKGMIQEAVDEFLKGIKYSHCDEYICFTLAEMLINEKRFKDAFDVLKEMPSSDNDLRRTALTGYCREGLESYDEAGQCADEALSLERDNSLALNLKGILAYRKGQRDEAGKLFVEALSRDTAFGEPYTNLGVLKWSAGLKDEALHFVEKGFVLSPHINDIATIYHSIISALGEYESAERRFLEAKSLYPLNRRIAFFLIDILIQQGKNERAIEEIGDAMILFGADDGMISAALKVREKVGPKEIPIEKAGTHRDSKESHGNLMTQSQADSISLCMIVKNEEKCLSRCLRSVDRLVGEMIVVDTGSDDRTKDIATIFGARVYDFEWTNDFSEARNFSLSKASGDWIMVLDADEMISPQDHDGLTGAVRKRADKAKAYSFVTRNYVREMTVTGWKANEGRYAEEAGSGWFPSEKVRLFRNDGRIRFDNPVHELVEASLSRAHIKVKKCEVPVHHYGKLGTEKVLSKGEDYYLLGKKKLEENGGDLQALFELAVQATELKRYDDAVGLWRRVIDFNGDVPGEYLSRAYLNIGGACLELGRYEEALLLSKKALELNPEMKGAVINYALSELCIGDVQNVINVTGKLLQSDPEYIPALTMLFAAYCVDGRSEQKRDCMEKIKRTGTDCAVYFHHYAKNLASSCRTGKAVLLLNAAVESNNINKDILTLLSECCAMPDGGEGTIQSKPDAAEAHFNLANACRKKGELDRAAAGFLKAIAVREDYAEAYNYLGNTVILQDKLEAAEACYRKALQINPGYVEAAYNLGNVLCHLKRYEEAVPNYRKAVMLKPDFAEAYYNLGKSLSALGKYDEAVMNYENALELRPEFPEVHNAVGNAFREKGKAEEAIASYKKALKLKPDFAEVYCNIGNVFLDMGDVEEALVNCRQSLALNPDLPDAHWNMASALLTKGDLKKGWEKYEWRFLKKDACPVPFEYPSWDGSSLKGRTLLVYAEQGVGDEIMFASCLPEVREQADACIVECDARLVPLFARSFAGIQVIERIKTNGAALGDLPPIDFQLAIGSMPRFFRASFSSFPEQKAYLIPDYEKSRLWHKRFNALGRGLKVGVSWRGGKELYVQNMRSTVLDQWRGLFSVHGIHFINLQYGDCTAELREAQRKMGVTICDWDDADPLKDLDNFAAQTAALDLVISVDNSTVHMAGALGVPVWTLLPSSSDWRWMMKYEDTPWYPTMRLFRQKHPGDWAGVFESVFKDLREFASGGVVFPIDPVYSYKSYQGQSDSERVLLSR